LIFLDPGQLNESLFFGQVKLKEPLNKFVFVKSINSWLSDEVTFQQLQNYIPIPFLPVLFSQNLGVLYLLLKLLLIIHELLIVVSLQVNEVVAEDLSLGQS
jgi:hypothetical protein